MINNLVLYDSGNQKHENYIALLCNNNFENNFDIVIVDIKIKMDQLYIGCIYSNINDRR